MGQRAGRIHEFIPMPSEAEEAERAAMEADPLGAVYEGGVAGLVTDAENAIADIADAFEDAVGAALGGPSVTGELMSRPRAEQPASHRAPTQATQNTVTRNDSHSGASRGRSSHPRSREAVDDVDIL